MYDTAPVLPNREMLRLRALLDERGIEYETYNLPDLEHGVSWFDCNGIEWEAVQQGENFEIHALQLVTPEQAVAATVGPTLDQDLQQALDFMRIWITDDAHLGESDISYELEKAEGLRNLKAIEQAIAVTVGNAMTLDEATEYAERFMGDYAKVLLASTLYVERDEPTDQHAFDVAEQKEAQMARDLAEALATAGVGTCHKKWRSGYGFCSECGHNITGNWAIYCPNCGRKVIRTKEEAE